MTPHEVQRQDFCGVLMRQADIYVRWMGLLTAEFQAIAGPASALGGISGTMKHASEIRMTKLALILGSAGMLALCGGPAARAQNVLGAEQVPANPAEVQQQLERQRHDLDAMNCRGSDCSSRNEAAVETPAIGQRPVDATPPHSASTCAP
jgi:hypothetical protein